MDFTFSYTLRLIGSIVYEFAVALLTFPLLVFPRLRQAVQRITRHPATLKNKSLEVHEREVAKIAASVSEAHRKGSRVVLRRRPGTGHSGRAPLYKIGHHGVDVASLTSILSIDVAEQVAHVQSGITFESLCRATLRHGLLPLVVPEFRSITVGGAIQGIGIESTSWVNGAFDESVLEATLVLGDGLVVASHEVPELWSHVPGSNGTLALVVAAKLRLIEASSTIRIKYSLLPNITSFLETVQTKTKEPKWTWRGSSRAIDGMAIRNVGIVTMQAGCVDEQRISYNNMYQETPFSPFYFQHVHNIALEKLASNPGLVYVEHQPMMQYLFRYDRGGFWGIVALTKVLPVLKFVLDRPYLTGLLNHFLSTATLYKVAMLISDHEREAMAMLQDVDVPNSKAQIVIEWAMKRGFQYLWLCPVKNGSKSMFSVSGSKEWVLNIGLYGACHGLPQANLELQRLVAECSGKTALYAHIYASRDEFWSWYDGRHYDYLREAYHANTFLGLWEKVGGITSRSSAP